MEYRRELDGLRALAVLPVILFHAGYQTFSGGFVGVDIFFVISGYLITSIILAEQQAGTFSLVDFYERRARRILPMLFFVLAVSIPFAWLWLMPDDMREFSQGLTAVSLFSSNILFWLQSGYFDTAAELKPLLHTWSLGVEEQFYLFLPLFLIFAWRWGKRWMVGLLVIAALLSLAIAQWGAANKPDAAFFLLPTRGWELLLGAFAAFHFSRKEKPDWSPALHETLSLAGLLLIVYAVFAFTSHTPFPGLYALVPTLGALLIITFANQNTLTGKLLGNRLLVGIGLISYSAYLWHQPLFAFARHGSRYEPGAAIMALLAVVSIGLAYLSWRFIERPFRRKDVVSRQRIFTLAAMGSVAFIVFGLAGMSSHGFETARTTALQQHVLQTALFSPMRRQCHTNGSHYLKPEQACAYGGERVDWAVFGDSHAVELGYALSQQLALNHEGLRHFSFSDCPPSWGITIAEHPNCSKWTQEAVDYIARNPHIRNVVVSYRINSELFGEHGLAYPLLPNSVDAGERERRWRAYVNMLRHFIQSGKHVIVVLQAPELPRKIGALIYRNKLSPQQIRGVSREWWNRRSAFVRAHLAQIPHEVTVIDPAPLFCDNRACYAVKDGTALYFDSHHLSINGGRVVVAEILKRANTPTNMQVAMHQPASH
ncbi:MAG TPA: acyltransferase family protein [Methylophilaceae bacterium]|nr:acyltransferase family protein [Methylophilaceae bacterium]